MSEIKGEFGEFLCIPVERAHAHARVGVCARACLFLAEYNELESI